MSTTTVNPYILPSTHASDWPDTPSALFHAIVARSDAEHATSPLPEFDDAAKPWTESSLSTLYRTVLKRPRRPEVQVVGGQVTSNIVEIATSFLRELRLFRLLAPHPNIAGLFGCIPDVGMVLEQVDGDHLGSRLSRDPALGFRFFAVDWAQGIMKGLLHIHALGLTHGDLCLENILITPGNTVKLVEFGHSTVLGERVYPGTLPFVAPEVVSQDREVVVDGQLCDAYALGVVMLAISLDQVLTTKNIPATCSLAKDTYLPFFGRLIRMYYTDESELRARVEPLHLTFM